ncbi:MAG: TniQ family protein [Rubrimonas sp.]
MSWRWHHAPRLRGGELLSSALVQAARQHGHTPWRFTELNWPGNRVWTRDIDLYPATDIIDTWARHGGTDRAELRAATLEGQHDALGGSVNGSPFITSLGVWHTRRKRHGLAFCPDCLAEAPGLWRKVWRYAFVVSCPRHDRLLSDACPICDAPLAPHRNLDPDVDRCDQCRADLRPAQRVARADAEAVVLQYQLTCSLEARLAPMSAQADAVAASTEAASLGMEDYRALLGVVANPWTRDALAVALSVELLPRAGGASQVFERARLRWRAESLLLVQRWSAEWPGGFLKLCRMVGLTQRAFARTRPGQAVLDAIRSLPERRRYNRMHPPLVHDAETRRVRRRDPAAYRECRADRLLRHASTAVPSG